ncbi:MAG: hypothetical protein ABIH23_26935 [bacterium]
MDCDLYFISMIEQALKEPDPKAALVEAFKEIRDLGTRPEHEYGFRQFLWFMETVAESAVHGDKHTDEERLLDFIADDPQWKEAIKEFNINAESSIESSQYPVIEVMRDNDLVGLVAFDVLPASGEITRLVPGEYVVRFDSGRIIWKGTLEAKHLRWAAAYPGRPLRMAAKTGETTGPATLDESLLGGEIHLRIFPGVEVGRMEITVTKSAER